MQAPPIQFDLQIFNAPGDAHLPADERGMRTLHSANGLASLAGAALVGVRTRRAAAASASVHLAPLIIVAAFLLDALASLCERVHLGRYATDGVGSYTADALSAILEATDCSR